MRKLEEHRQGIKASHTLQLQYMFSLLKTCLCFGEQKRRQRPPLQLRRRIQLLLPLLLPLLHQVQVPRGPWLLTLLRKAEEPAKEAEEGERSRLLCH